MLSRTALQLNAAIGLATSLLAAATIWLTLTRPADVATALAQRDYGGMAVALGHELAGWLHVLLRLL